MTGAELLPFEVRALRDMSKAYSEAAMDTEPLSVAPLERGSLGE